MFLCLLALCLLGAMLPVASWIPDQGPSSWWKLTSVRYRVIVIAAPRLENFGSKGLAVHSSSLHVWPEGVCSLWT